MYVNLNKITKKVSEYIFGSKDRLEVLKGATSTFLLKVGGTGIGYLFNLFVARTFGASVVGLYGLAITVSAVVRLVAKFGTQTSSVRLIAQSSSEGNTESVRQTHWQILTFSLPIAIGLGTLLFIAAPALSWIFDEVAMQAAIHWVAVTVPLGVVVGINQGCLRGVKRIRDAYTYKNFLPPALNLFGVGGLVLVGVTGKLTPIYAHTITYVVLALGSSVTWFYVTSIGKENFGGQASGTAVPAKKQIFSLSWPLLITSSMHFIMGWTDEIVLGIFTSTSEIGIYRIAYKMAMATGFTLQAVNSITAPKIAKLYTEDKQVRLRKVVRISSRLIFWTAVPILGTLIVLPNTILGLFGSEFVQASGSLLVLCFGQFLAATCGPVGYMLTMTKYERVFQWILVTGAILNVSLNILLVPMYGILGAALATTSSLVVWNIASSVFAYQAFGYWVGYCPRLNLSK